MEELNRFRFLFLDRDGVINVERKDDYVKSPSEFVFEDRASEAIAILSKTFEDIFIVTNQRGVGRGVMSSANLDEIHCVMMEQIRKAGGDIKNIYYCTDIDSTSENRKPNVGMGMQAKADFPKVEFPESIMVGNSKSDIEFGKRLGMYTVLVGDKYAKTDEIYQIADAYYMNLYQFALSLQHKLR